MVLAFWVIFVFCVGAAVGSFLNVAVARLPLEKSLVWPNSRCGNCLQTIPWYDNIPILSYLWLRGQCRTCGQRFSIGYMIIELTTALAFVGLFWVEIVENIFGWHAPLSPTYNLFFFPWESLASCGMHALLFSFLMVATVCDLKSREIPLQLTLTGTIVGLVCSALMPWPFPNRPAPVYPVAGVLPQGMQVWPFWVQIDAQVIRLPDWCGAGGNVQTGLVTGIVGALVGTFLLRAIGFVFSAGLGREALGLGDADLMMMAGAFLGWQLVVVAFFLSVFPALVFGIIQLAVRRDHSLPFGPALSFSVMGTCLLWERISPPLRDLLFSGTILVVGIVFCGSMLFLMSFVLRVIRGGNKEEPT